MILHLDADAFFASVEQAADPRLRGKAIAVGGERRGIIASASYEARQRGVYTPMPTARARRVCPGLIVIPGDYERYELFSRLMFAYAFDFTPCVEQTSIDEGYADLTPNREADPRIVAERIGTAISQSLKISISRGIASNKLVSQIASKLRKPAGFVDVPFGTERDFLAPLANRWLPGVGPQLGSTLDAAGLRVIAQIAATPPEQLMLFAGAQALQLRDFARGIDERPVVPERPSAKSYSHQETFPTDVTDEAFLIATLRHHADLLMAKVRADSKCIRTVALRIRYNDMEDVLRSHSFNEPTDLETDLYHVIARLLKQAWTRRVSLRLVGLRLSNLYDSMPLELPLDADSSRRIALQKATSVIDSLRASGFDRIMRGHDLWLKTRDQQPRDDLARPPRATPPQSQIPNPPTISNHTTTVSEAPAAYLPSAPHPSPITHYPLPSPHPSPTLPPSPLAPGPSPAKPSFLALRSSFSFLDSLLTPEAIVAEAVKRGARAVGICDPNLHGAVPFAQAAKAAGIKAVIGAEVIVDRKRYACFVRDKTGYSNLCELLSLARINAAVFSARQDGLIVLDAADPALPEIRYTSPADRTKYDIVQSIRTLTRLHEPHPEKRTASAHWPSPDELARLPADALRRAEEIANACNFEFDLNHLHFPAFATPDGSTPREFLRKLVLDGFETHYGPHAADIRRQVEEELSIIAEVGYEEYFLVVWDILQECRRRGIAWITRGSAGDSLVCRCLGISDFCPVRFELYFRRFLNRDRMALNKLPDIDLDFPHDRKDDVIDLILEKFGQKHCAVVGGFNTFRARSAVGEILKVLGVAESQVRRFTENFPYAELEGLPSLLQLSQECGDLPLDEEPYKTAVELAVFLDGFPRYPKMHPCGVVFSRVPIRSLTPTFTSGKGYPTTHFDMDAAEAVGLVKMDILAQGGLAVMRDTLATLRARNIEVTLPGAPWEDTRIWELIATGNARGVHHIESPAMISLARMCGVRDIDRLIAIVSVIRPGAANTTKKVTFARRCQGMEPVDYTHPSLEPVLRSTFGVVAYEEHILQICDAFAGLPGGRADVLRRALVKQKKAVIAEIKTEFAASALARGRTPEEIATVWALVEAFQGYAFCRAHSTAYGIEAFQAAYLKTRHPAEFLAAVLSNGKGFYSTLVYTLEARRLGITFAPPCVNRSTPAYTVDPNSSEPISDSALPPASPSSGTASRSDSVLLPITHHLSPAPPPSPLAQSLSPADAGRSAPSIRVPLSAIKNLTGRTLKACAAGRPFRDIDDFIRRVPAGIDELQALIRVGAFDVFGEKRAIQFWRACALASEAGRGEALDVRPDLTPPPSALADPTLHERLTAETELLGFAVSDHPLQLRPDIDWTRYTAIADMGRHPGATITICGLIIDQRLHPQANGALMKFITLCDRTGMIECEMFADTYTRFGALTSRHGIIAATGIVEMFDNQQGWTLRIQSVAGI